MRKFAKMNLVGILNYLIAFTMLTHAELAWYWVFLFGVLSFPLGSLLWDLIRGKKHRPTLHLEIRNEDNPRYPEYGDPKINILCLHIVLVDDLTILAEVPVFLDNKKRTLSWGVPNPEDFQGSFAKSESPARIYVEELDLEESSKSIRAKARFEERWFKVFSNKVECENLLSMRVYGVRRKLPGERSDTSDW